MKRWTILFFLLGCGAVNGCGEKEPGNEQPQDNSIVLTLKDENNTAIAHQPVYVFEDETTLDPEAAIASGLSDGSGVFRMTLKGSQTLNKTALYFTCVERPLSLEYKLLGQVELPLPTVEADFSAEMILSGRKQAYPHGYVPTAFDSKLAKDEYIRWKNTQLVTCGNGVRPVSDPRSESKVEAVGFGTILSAYANDKATFDGLMAFYESKRTAQANQMMAWSVTCEDILDPGSATDGDIDVAFANIVAYTQWGGDYLDKAKEILAVIKGSVITTCTVDGASVKVLYPGYSDGPWGGCGMTDIQYYTPAFSRVFAKVTGDDLWTQLADDSYTLLNAAANETTGLVPDWHTAAGAPGPGGRVGYFGYDACRVPWRMTLDYLWNGNEDAQAWCTKVSNWAYEIGAPNIVDGYELDGTPRGPNGVNSAFLGGFTVSMMANSFGKVNTYSTTLETLNDSYWFNLNTRVLYLFALTGNMWEPVIE
jgi:endo-1,4-beta-D-glucanase Y